MPTIFGVKITGAQEISMKWKLAQPIIRKRVEVEMFNAGLIIAERAKEILDTVQWKVPSEKKDGSPRTYGYRRGDNSKTAEYYPPGSTVIGHIQSRELRNSISAVAKAPAPDKMEVNIGTWKDYAPYIEALPDGGFLYKAYLEKRDATVARLQGIIRAMSDSKEI